MKSLIYFPITVLFVFMLFSMVNTGTISEGYGYSYQAGSTFNGTIIENDEQKDLEIPVGDIKLEVSPVQGMLLIMATIITVGGLIGIRFLGSGLSVFSQIIITKGLFYYGTWTILSILAYKLISELWIVGSFIYLILTAMYTFGFIQGLSGGDEL